MRPNAMIPKSRRLSDEIMRIALRAKAQRRDYCISVLNEAARTAGSYWPL